MSVIAGRDISTPGQKACHRDVRVTGIEPLFLDDSAARALILSGFIATAVAELYVLVRNRGSKNHIDLSESLVGGSFLFGIGLGLFAVHLEIGVFGGGWTVVILGMLIFLLGMGFRYWAIFTLGRFFVHTVAIQADHHIVRSGPYRLLRHPSYTGLMIALAGLGIALQNWLSLLVLVGLPLIGVLIRIKVEDDALTDALGDQYVEYAEETRRLIPGLW